jgi:predicted nucleic acid-binding protein
MAGLILDSDALLAIMNSDDGHHESIKKRLLQGEDSLSISVVTYSEALVYPYQEDNYVAISEGIQALVNEIHDVTVSIATRAAQIRAVSKVKWRREFQERSCCSPSPISWRIEPLSCLSK